MLYLVGYLYFQVSYIDYFSNCWHIVFAGNFWPTTCTPNRLYPAATFGLLALFS